MAVVLFLPRGDRRQVLRAQQGEEGAAVDDRQATLVQLHAGAGQAGDLAGEDRLVADQEDVAAARGEAGAVERAAAQLLGDLRLDAERARRRAARSPPPAASGW